MLAVILTTQLMVVLDGTIVNVALPPIQHALSFSTEGLSWVINAYALTFGGLLMLGARCGDLLGRRRSFLAGIALFAAGSLLGGLATTGWMLLAARAVQGVGGAVASPAVLALLMSLYPDGRARTRAIGTFAAVSVGGAATGLLAGGLLTQIASWRWVFFVNIPIAVVVIVLGALVIDETPRRTGHFDLIGAVTSTAGVSSLVYAFVEAAAAGWFAGRTLAAFAMGATLLAVFVRAESQASMPILPLHLLMDRERGSALLARGLLSAGVYGMFFFLTQYLQDVRGYSPLEAGVAFLPIPLTIFVVSQLTTRVLVERFPARLLMFTGLSLSTLGMVIDSQLTTTSGYAQLLASMVLFAAGNGISFVMLTATAVKGVDASDAAAASGLVNVTQQLGAALGVAVLVSVFGAASNSAVSPAAFTSGIDAVFAGAAALLGAAIVFLALAGQRRVPARVSPL
jgi:EmrB/QacA subfamily drug resistance transporter